ncbi:MAG TPA: ATP-grasp domain-containing protein [Methanocella sp.]|jgi:biotin carboxylase
MSTLASGGMEQSPEEITMKSVIIVGAGVMQVPAIKIAKSMGLNVIATDRDPEAEGFKYADVPVIMDTKDVPGHVQFATANREKYNISGAFSGADVAITVAGITNALGLPGIPMDVAVRSNNKAMMKKCWLKAGIPTPYSIEVDNYEDAVRAIKEINGFPIMVKAIDNAASRGTKKITTMDELGPALADAKNNSTTGTALIEEVISGEEQSVETVVYKGVHYRFGVADRHFGFSPFPIETGHTNPSQLPADIQEEMYAIVKKAAIALGIDFGPAKADTMLTEDGPKMLEMPARLSGGFHSMYTTPIATGMNPIRAVLNLAIGNPMPEEDAVQKLNRVSVCKAIFPAPGKIISIKGIEEARKIKGVEQIFLMVKEGELIKEYKNCANRVCYIITSGDTCREANDIFDLAAGTIKIKTAS